MAKKKTKEQEFLFSYINPELRSEMNTMQPLDYNPYGRLGPMPPNEYSYWNHAGSTGQEVYFDPAD
jgi:hypothetical protein